MQHKMDIIFVPEENESPRLLLSMRKVNHIYLGVYRGFDKKTLKEVTRYYWAEHGGGDQYMRCFVSDDLENWTLDAISNSMIEPFPVSEIQAAIIKDIRDYLNEVVNVDGIIDERYQNLISESGSPFLVIKDDDSNLQAPEIDILDSLNRTWFLDASLQFNPIEQ